MLDYLATESAFLKIEALAAAAGYLWEPEERQLRMELIGAIEMLARRSADDVVPSRNGGGNESSSLHHPQRSGAGALCQQGGAGNSDHVA